jgi:hypothetical protein
MEQFIGKILEQVAGQGLSMAFTVIAVWYLHGKIKECEHDRAALWEKIMQHLEEK